MMCTAPVTLLTIVLASFLFSSSKSFVLVPQPWQTFVGVTRTASSILYAKKKNKNKKRPNGSSRGAGRRGKIKRDGNTIDNHVNKASSGTATAAATPEPSRIRKRKIHLERTGIGGEFVGALSVCTVEVDDVEWWENPENQNPYGGRLWPSALAISEFLVAQGNLDGYDVLELGCGAGLVSIVAAESGARVVASDISPTIMKLCKIGWLETQKQREKQSKRSNKKDATEVEDESIIIKPGSLNTSIVDLFSNKPLPLSTSSKNQKVVIATAMMYEQSLATGLARRAIEACASGAWVIIGDDDTGERDGGRAIFVSELDRLKKEKGVEFQSIWTSSVVKSKELNWSAKRVKILHLNAPAHIFSSDVSVKK